MSSEQAVVDEHEQMIEVRVTWRTAEDGIERESESERPICRCCWREGPDGKPRHADWPCEVVTLRADLAAAREREARLREMLAAVWQRPVGDAGWYCLRCDWGNQHAPSCILATPVPPEPQAASSEPTVPAGGDARDVLEQTALGLAIVFRDACAANVDPSWRGLVTYTDAAENAQAALFEALEEISPHPNHAPPASKPTPPGGHHAIMSPTPDGWVSRCPCGWRYEGTSAAITEEAGELHQSGWSTTPSAGEDAQYGPDAGPHEFQRGCWSQIHCVRCNRISADHLEQPAASTPSGEASSDE